MAGIVKKKRRKRGLMWTESQRATAELFRQGLTFDEVVDRGVSKNMASRVHTALSKGQLPPDQHDGSPQAVLEEKPQKTTTGTHPPAKHPTPKPRADGPPAGAFETKWRIDTAEPLTLGAIQVLPEDWRITQHGYLLIVDTYYLTKEKIGYDGTIGQFMVDVLRFYRHCLQFPVLPEVGPGLIQQPVMEVPDNGRPGEEADNGAGVCEEGGADFDEPEW